LRALVEGDDRAAAYAWRVLSETLVYAAERAEQIADDLPRIDDAMRWGWNWELGPFEQWDALGVAAVVARLESEGRAVPELAREALAGGGAFYRRGGSRVQVLHFDGRWRPREPEPGTLVLRELKREKTVQANADASLIDLGDGVLGLEFHSKLNTLGPGVLEMIRRAVVEVESGWEALVIGNQGRMFSAGANLVGLLAAAEARGWDQIDAMTREFQNTLMAVKQCRRPAVAAVHAQALGGGCELALQSARVQAAAESYMGLVELLVGLIPAGGGCKEMVLRAGECLPGDAAPGESWGPLHRAFETIGLAKVSGSAAAARELGFLRPVDGISINPGRHLQDAKALALLLARAGHHPYRPRTDIPVPGEPALARFKLELHLAERAGHLSPFDRRLGTALATVLCGGALTAARPVSEQYLLDLEREQFVSLCAEEKTLERIRHMLKTNRPLRN
jgi:3-hydroxyacyl-CoA dehydrogenase